MRQALQQARTGERSRAHSVIAQQFVERQEVSHLLFLHAEPPLQACACKDEWAERYQEQHACDGKALLGDRAFVLVTEPRPLQHASILREAHLVATILLGAVAIQVHRVAVNRKRPVLHLPVHEGAGGELQPSHQLVKVQGGFQVEGHDIVPTSALIPILHSHPTSGVRRKLGGVALAHPNANWQVGLLERDIDRAELFALLPWQHLLCRQRRDAVLRNIRRQCLLHRARNIHDAIDGLLYKVRQVLAVVTIESDALEPTEEQSGLVFPFRWHAGTIQDHFRQHDVSHIVPDAGVDELDAPLLREVRPHLVADLLASLVHQVRHILPCDLVDINVKDAPCGRHVPCRGVPGAHVEDHVHVLEGE
mmetsp:Transcript_32621/g.93670  ORF Transcript_32621/g.93670 Transcript_32621/m.93670 type:complete len:364 (+) Transcript_32621:124-1215(+)